MHSLDVKELLSQSEEACEPSMDKPTAAEEEEVIAGSAIDLARYVPSYITLIANKWARNASALYIREFGIGIVDWRLMSLLAIEPWIQASRVDEVVGMDKGAVSRSLRGLEKMGLVMTRRNVVDPRRREMALTPAGRRMHDKIARIALTREAVLLSGFSEEEKEVLLGFMVRMRRNLSDLQDADYELISAGNG